MIYSEVYTQLGQAIGALGQAEFAGHLAEFLGRCAPYDNLAIFAYRGEAKPLVLHTLYRNADVYAELDEYVDAAYLLDPFFRAHRARVPAGVYPLADVAPDQFKRSAYYRSYYKKTTIVDEICAIAYTSSGYSVHVSMGTDRSSGRPFSRRARAELKAREPVICALLAQHWADLQASDVPSNEEEPQDESLSGRLTRALQAIRGVELSGRQAEVALLILQGHSSASIALRLDISPQTVKVHRKLLYAKCEICSQAELFALMLPVMAGFGSNGMSAQA
jgi:DNA-binding CsgD family transcriptional regulator